MNAVSPTILLSKEVSDRGDYAFGGKAKFFEGDLTADQIVEQAGLNWKVEKRPIAFRKQNGSTKTVPSKFALVRDTDESFLSLCGSVFKPVQNEQTFGFMKKFTDAGHMQMRAAGDLCNGQYVWGLAEVGDKFTLPGKDEVKGYLLIVSPHIAGRAWIAKHISLRMFCWNQFPSILQSMAAGRRHGGKEVKGQFRMPHTLEFNEEVQQAAEEALGLSRKSLKEFQAAAEKMVETPCTTEQADDYFQQVLKIGSYKPSAVMDAVIAATETGTAFDAVLSATADSNADVVGSKERTSPVLVKMREALLGAPGQDAKSAKGTLWGAFNAVTYVLEHQVCSNADRRLRDNWLGGRAVQKQEALQIALQRAA